MKEDDIWKYKEKILKTKRKLKRYFNEKNHYDRILEHIKMVKSYDELCNHPFSIMYGFERLKYFKDEYYSFNLGKNKGVIRLIFKIDRENNVVILKFISMDHYNDFKRKRGGGDNYVKS